VDDHRFGERLVAGIEKAVLATLEDAVDFALASPDPPRDLAEEDVYA
jgi:hypothetical protein